MKFLNKLLLFVRLLNDSVLIISSIVFIIGIVTGLFMYTITLFIWQLILFILAPWIIYWILLKIHSIRKRKFTRGDAVKMIADNRKFIVIRYHFWLPMVAICKWENHDTVFAVHEKFLQPYQEAHTQPFDFNISKFIDINGRQGRIKRL